MYSHNNIRVGDPYNTTFRSVDSSLVALFPSVEESRHYANDNATSIRAEQTRSRLTDIAACSHSPLQTPSVLRDRALSRARRPRALALRAVNLALAMRTAAPISADRGETGIQTMFARRRVHGVT